MAGHPKCYVLDMFPYPSGAGLHVGHPLGYIGTDAYARFLRMTGHNVLHPFGYDAFGLPAEQYAIDTGQHPAVTTRHNIDNMRRQLRRLGLGHDTRREIATSDPAFYRWTQWIFLRIFNSWFDEDANRARPIADLVPSSRRARAPARWPGLERADRADQRRVVDGHRLAYISTELVNWCPGLGTVLANEEVTADGRSDVGNYPVYRRPLRQWMLRITAYAERLLDDLDGLDWPESIKQMQRNWIGRSDGARIDLAVAGREDVAIEVFTTRPDTLAGATYVVLAPEHPLVDELTAARRKPRDAVRAYRDEAGRRGATEAAERRAERPARPADKTGVLHRQLRDQPGHRRADPGLRRRLRADGLRHRRDHGRARARRARPGVRAEVRPADPGRGRPAPSGRRARAERGHAVGRVAGGLRRRPATGRTGGGRLAGLGQDAAVEDESAG